MASKVIVQMVDDITGQAGGDIATVPFAVEGTAYEIDLSAEGRDGLAEARAEVERIMAPFFTKARKIKPSPNGRGHSAGKAPTGDAERARKIREWAAENGHEVSGRGRISKEVIQAYDAAQADHSKAVGMSIAKSIAERHGADVLTRTDTKGPEKPLKAAQAAQEKETKPKPTPRKRAPRKTAGTSAVASLLP
jgi:hypothetical protein